MSDAKLYIQAGNSVCVSVIERIAEKNKRSNWITYKLNFIKSKCNKSFFCTTNKKEISKWINDYIGYVLLRYADDIRKKV